MSFSIKIKTAVFLLIFSLSLIQIKAEKRNIISFTLNAGIKNISENLSERVYGKNNLVFSADLAFKPAQFMEIFLHSDYFSAKGETTLTGDATKLTIFPLELGVRFLIGKANFNFYLGAGGGYYFYKEKVTIDNDEIKIDDKEYGFFAEAGLRIKIIKAIFFDLKGKYVYLKVKPESPSLDANDFIYAEERNLSGFAITAGLGINL